MIVARHTTAPEGRLLNTAGRSRLLNRPRHSEIVVIGGGTAESFADTGNVSVRLSAIEGSTGSVTYFAIDVIPRDGGVPWRVMRRYSEFRWLRDILWPERKHYSDFPRKHLTRCIGTKLEARRSGLELWLNSVLRQCENLTLQNLGCYLDRFMLVGRFAAPVLAEMPTLTEAEAPPPDTGDDSLALLRVDLPSGVGHGYLIAVTAPDGERVNISVPWGLTPGSTLELWYDHVARTLGVDWQATRPM